MPIEKPQRTVGGDQMLIDKSSSRLHPAWHRAGNCDGYRRRFNNVPRAPMLQDVLRRKLAVMKEVLCAECCFKRAFERGIDLMRTSLKLRVLNLAGCPRSYFDLFTTAQKHGPERLLHILQWYMEMLGVRDVDQMARLRQSKRQKFTSHERRGSAL
jgi:hypothetical protein